MVLSSLGPREKKGEKDELSTLEGGRLSVLTTILSGC